MHVYGLTETTVSSTFFRLDPADPVARLAEPADRHRAALGRSEGARTAGWLGCRWAAPASSTSAG
jgi:hypothetical protein